KNGSENGSSRSNESNGERERGELSLRGTTTCAFALTGPISSFPECTAAIALLNVTILYVLPLIVSRFSEDCCNFCAVNPCPVISGGSVSCGWVRGSYTSRTCTGTILAKNAIFFIILNSE